MPRQSRGPAPAPRRPVAAPPPRPAAVPQQQTRQASTAAHPPAAAPPQQQAASGGSGLFGQMASTAAGVAVGSSIGHAIGGFFGSGSSASQQQVDASAAPQGDVYGAQNTQYAQQQSTGACANDVNNSRRCMDENAGSLTICGWYLDQLKACQQASAQY